VTKSLGVSLNHRHRHCHQADIRKAIRLCPLLPALLLPTRKPCAARTQQYNVPVAAIPLYRHAVGSGVLGQCSFAGTERFQEQRTYSKHIIPAVLTALITGSTTIDTIDTALLCRQMLMSTSTQREHARRPVAMGPTHAHSGTCRLKRLELLALFPNCQKTPSATCDDGLSAAFLWLQRDLVALGAGTIVRVWDVPPSWRGNGVPL
jgi:hypothetical protein